MFGEAMALASTLAEGRKHAAAERITELATAARDVTTTFHDLPFLRDYTEAAADRLDELAVYVDDTDLPDIINDIATFARRQPMATLALTVAAGFVTSQLVRDWPVAMVRMVRERPAEGGAPPAKAAADVVARVKGLPAVRRAPGFDADPTLAGALLELVNDAKAWMAAEVELIKAQLQESSSKVQSAAIAVVLAVVIALAGIIVLGHTLVFVLAPYFGPALAGFTIAGALIVIAAALFMYVRSQLDLSKLVPDRLDVRDSNRDRRHG